MTDLIRRTAAELADALAAGETTSVELTQAHLDRIAEVDGDSVYLEVAPGIELHVSKTAVLRKVIETTESSSEGK